MNDRPLKIGLVLLAIGGTLGGLAVGRYVVPAQAAPAPAPAPAPTPPAPLVPAAPLKLTAGELYVVDAPYEAFLIGSPAELVTITKKPAPITIHSRFAGGSGKIETKVFQGPVVYTVEAAGTGPCELLLIKSGAKGDGDVTHRLIDAELAPQPPPEPPKPPVPPPTPPPIPGQGLRVLIVYDKHAPLPRPQQEIINGAAVRSFLNANCAKGPDGKTPERRFLDPIEDVSNESPAWQAAMKRPRQSLPWIIIGNGSVNPPGWEGPLPATVDATLALLKKYAGG